LFGEREFGLRGDEGRIDDSLVRSFRGVIAFKGFGADSFFGEEFGGGAEEVVEESPFVGVEVVYGTARGRSSVNSVVSAIIGPIQFRNYQSYVPDFLLVGPRVPRRKIIVLAQLLLRLAQMSALARSRTPLDHPS
jgi:hypothetical protein